MAYPNAKILSNGTGDFASPYVNDYAFLQKGYTYGHGDSGYWQKFSREGAYASVSFWASVLDAAGWTWTVTLLSVNTGNNTGLAKIEASAGWGYPYLYGTETPEDIWELDPQDEQKNILNADYPFGSVNLTSKYSTDALSKVVEDASPIWYPASSSTSVLVYPVVQTAAAFYIFDDGASGAINITWDSTGANKGKLDAVPYYSNALPPVIHLPSADANNFYSLFLLMRAGVENFPVEASVIRHSLVTSNQWAVKASYVNANRIITTGSMYAIEGVPSNLLFSVPVTPSPNQFVESPGDLQYGWRKCRASVTRLSRMKWRITQNYQLGLWPVKLFGNPL